MTEWIEGEKFGVAGGPEMRGLCTMLLNAYLVQLLETGFLHADPHPGNLMLTPQGQVAILDFGLMTQVRVQLACWSVMLLRSAQRNC